MTVHLTERQARRVGLGKKRTRKKAKMPEGAFEAALRFRAGSGCWHAIAKCKRTGLWYCTQKGCTT